MFYPVDKSPHFYASHYQDRYTDLGFDYRGNIYKKTVSKILMKNKRIAGFLGYMDKIISGLVDNVKQIKLQYMISLDKKDRNLN